MKYTKIGRVSHYYDKIGVAIIELLGEISVGDKIKFVRGGEDLFEQTIDSIQKEHEKLEKAKKNDIVGIKVIRPVKDNAEVYSIIQETHER